MNATGRRPAHTPGKPTIVLVHGANVAGLVFVAAFAPRGGLRRRPARARHRADGRDPAPPAEHILKAARAVAGIHP